jgi:hypothetical protein
MSNWKHASEVAQRQYVCSYCSKHVAPNVGYSNAAFPAHKIFICPYCDKPTFHDGTQSYPAPAAGEAVNHITDQDVHELYEEARRCTSAGAYNAATLVCRKILMNFAVRQGAPGGKKFIEYVDYIVGNHLAPANSKVWIDAIRNKANEATHEIPHVEAKDARIILLFTGHLLKSYYEMVGIYEKEFGQSTTQI